MRRIPKIAYIVVAALALSGCTAQPQGEVVLATHDSVVISKELAAEFQKETGLKLVQVRAGDAGALTNKLILTKDSPIADAVYGIDNTFMGAATDAKILVPATVKAIDYADICFNYDVDWFNASGKPAPKDWADLTRPTYTGLTVLENPNTSSTGLGLLAATVARFGEGNWQEWWQELKDNGAKIDAGWEDAYYTDFSGAAGKGKFPIVLSYSSSPADEVNTAAIRNSCFRQTEYAATLTNAKNSAGAAKLIEWLQSKRYQDSMPTTMYVYPINPAAKIPESWTTKAPAALSVLGENLDVAKNRKSWLADWSKIFG